MVISSRDDTIAAIATPPGQGGIGIVRISGKTAKDVLMRLWQGSPRTDDFESHRLYYGPVGTSGEVIDRALVSWMKGPASYTGEDVCEISGHGGPAVMQALLNACCEAGARPAEPGEFTRRAFLKGKIDLSQAEAVADVIAASSKTGLKCAQDQLAGRLSREVTRLSQRLTELRAFVEASIDFPEEDIEFIEHHRVAEKLRDITEELETLADTFEEGRLARDGVRVTIVGPPNAGKSTLFNKLVGRERALVHHRPGTTRDVVDETIVIEGMTFHLHDTAGLRDSDCEVEQSGVALTKEEIGKADVVLCVVDATTEYENAVSFPEEKTIVVYNKCDIKEPGCPMPDARCPKISALTGTGIDELKQALLRFVRALRTTDAEGVVVASARHKKILDETKQNIHDASTALGDKQHTECIAEHLRRAHEALGRITGETVTESVLDEIFSHFCVGK